MNAQISNSSFKDLKPMCIKIFLLSLLFMSVHFLPAQNIPVGSWRNHSDYSSTQLVAQLGERIFAAGPNGLFYYDKEDESINTISTTTGLSGLQITALTTIPEDNMLVIGYQDGTLDLLDADLNISSFQGIRNADITESKKINTLFHQEPITYIGTDFGVVLFDAREKQIIDFYSNLGAAGNSLAISDIQSDGGNLYLGTPEGLLIGSINPQINLKDFQNWQRKPISTDIDIRVLKSVVWENNIVAIAANDIVYQLINNDWDTLYQSQAIINNLIISNNKLWLLAGNQALQFINNLFEVYFTGDTAGNLNDIISENNDFFIASGTQGLLKGTASNAQSILPQGPKGKPTVLKQIEAFTFSLNNMTPGFSYFLNGRWDYVGSLDNDPLPIFIDLTLDLATGNAVFLSANQGLYSWDAEEISLLTDKPALSNHTWQNIATDQQTNIWLLGKSENNEWIVYNYTEDIVHSLDISSAAQINDFEIIFNGDLYFATNNGIYVINADNSSNRLLNTFVGNGNLPSNVVADLSIDLSANLWIATANGACFFNNFQGVLEDESVDVIRPILDGFFLFDGIRVNQIAIDGGNRKWMSTRDGLWLFDENINENVLHLRRSNSPIIEENITQIGINPLNGEVFMASADQFLSYRTDATAAFNTHSNVEVFPNPVNLATDKTVTIRGLAFNNEVMITDLAGNLIHKGQANGGTFSWNLSNYSGFRVKRGVYIVFSINEEGSENYQTKFAVVN
jgi:ligand-binding sensor domain-containing protein